MSEPERVTVPAVSSLVVSVKPAVGAGGSLTALTVTVTVAVLESAVPSFAL